MRILLVEDDEAEAMLTQRALTRYAQRTGFALEIVWAQTVDAAVDQLGAGEWRGAVVDLTMGLYQGVEVVDRLAPLLQEHGGCLILTGHDENALQMLRRPLLQAGADAIFFKPCDARGIFNALDAVEVRREREEQRAPARIAAAVSEVGRAVTREVGPLQEQVNRLVRQMAEVHAAVLSSSHGNIPDGSGSGGEDSPTQEAGTEGQNNTRGARIAAVGKAWSSMSAAAQGSLITAILAILGGLTTLAATCTGNAPAKPVVLASPEIPLVNPETSPGSSNASPDTGALAPMRAPYP